MCDVTSALYVIGGMVAANAMSPGSPPGPQAPKQAAKMADQSGERRATMQKMSAGQRMAAMLTGPGGIAQSDLSLGRNTLLGG